MFTFNLTIFDADFIFNCWGISITYKNGEMKIFDFVQTSFSCSLPMAPLIFAENASFGLFFSGAGNFIIDTFLTAAKTIVFCLSQFSNSPF